MRPILQSCKPDTVEGLAVLANPRAALRGEGYGGGRAAILSEAGFAAAEQEISRWPGYAPTALRALPQLAARLGVAEIHYKDESTRFGLKSFKALGGAYAVFRLLQRAVALHLGERGATVAEILAGRYRELASALTVTCATDGNHGRSVAWGAQLFGCRCVIYVHSTVSEGRCAAIAQYGAEVIRVPGNYDDSVRHAAGEAARHGWTVISDTSYDGYRDIPIDVMHGYGVMARELVRQCGDTLPTHVLVQAGVGGLAAAVCAAFWLAWGERRPVFVIIEPERADCFLRSALAGHPVAVPGDLDTVMAGLACGEVSPLAWEILRGGADCFATVADRHALDGMRVLARPQGGDPAIVAGETGAAGLALLLASVDQPVLRRALGIDATARVLLIGSEGDTDPAIYQQVVGVGADAVNG
jgi:diaminopropionate ammonia-lyase